ncbi:ferritin family protein [uncultured Acetobacteroides sp.]|uniref:ferritin family protein n=1 Tax=uncultured Acetobacteroides sp. TaxID=1760811 RepID=UPI0029F5B1CB|nr:ferritin family protein [uncultured Acetobacteroides sp.]
MSVTKSVLTAQKEEITGYTIYNKLAEAEKDPHNAQLFRDIAQQELRHYNALKDISGVDIEPNRWSTFRSYFITRTLGLTFGVKLMEKNEQSAQKAYAELEPLYPFVAQIREDEEKHEHQLIDMINEEKLKYVGRWRGGCAEVGHLHRHCLPDYRSAAGGALPAARQRADGPRLHDCHCHLHHLHL